MTTALMTIRCRVLAFQFCVVWSCTLVLLSTWPRAMRRLLASFNSLFLCMKYSR